MHLLIVSGRSGAGKSSALGALEDLDFYCIDNLPVALLKNPLEAMGFLVWCSTMVGVAIYIEEREKAI